MRMEANNDIRGFDQDPEWEWEKDDTLLNEIALVGEMIRDAGPAMTDERFRSLHSLMLRNALPMFDRRVLLTRKEVELLFDPEGKQPDLVRDLIAQGRLMPLRGHRASWFAVWQIWACVGSLEWSQNRRSRRASA